MPFHHFNNGGGSGDNNEDQDYVTANWDTGENGFRLRYKAIGASVNGVACTVYWPK